jgi:hypothetical protein
MSELVRGEFLKPKSKTEAMPRIADTAGSKTLLTCPGIWVRNPQPWQIVISSREVIAYQVNDGRRDVQALGGAAFLSHESAFEISSGGLQCL